MLGRRRPARRRIAPAWTPRASRKNATSKAATAKPGELQRVEFRVGGLEPGTHQGFVRIVGEDGLAADDTRYFTVAVKPAWRVLLAAPKPAESYALFLAEALAPELYRKRRPGAVRLRHLRSRRACQAGACRLCRRVPAGSRRRWSRPPGRSWPITRRKATAWRSSWAETPLPVDSFNEPQAQELLPGKLLRQARAARRRPVAGPARFSASRSWRPSAARPARSPGTPFPCFAIGNSIGRPRAWASCCPIATASRRCWNGPSAGAAC